MASISCHAVRLYDVTTYETNPSSLLISLFDFTTYIMLISSDACMTLMMLMNFHDFTQYCIAFWYLRTLSYS